MTYKKRFIATVKHKGNILREQNGQVRLPFGSEYSILLKNLESVNATATITVDGKDVLKGNRIIVAPNSSVELKGFMDRAIIVKNRFRFIEKTDEIRNFRGDRLDDGIIRVEFTFEKKVDPVWYVTPGQEQEIVKRTMKSYYPDVSFSFSHTVGGMNSSSVYCSSLNCSAPANEDGITVKGSQTRQAFNYGDVGTLEDQSHVIILRLTGTVIHVAPKKIKNTTVLKQKVSKVRKPVMARTKLQCSSCGRRWKSSFKFCPNCSTFLE